MAINIAKQLLGTAKGEQVEQAEDSVLDPIVAPLEKLGVDFAKSELGTFLTGKGYPATLEGAAEFVDAQIEDAVNASGIPAQAKTDLEAALKAIFSVVNAKIPAVTI